MQTIEMVALTGIAPARLTVSETGPSAIPGKPQRVVRMMSKAQQLAGQLLEADRHSDSEKDALKPEYRFHDHDETVPMAPSQLTPRGVRPRRFGPSSQKTADHIHQTGDIYPDGARALKRAMRNWQRGPRKSRTESIVNCLLDNDPIVANKPIVVTNSYDGKKYEAIGQYWPEQEAEDDSERGTKLGWHLQIYDFSPNTWGRDPSGVGDGPVIDSGFQHQLERRGWVFPEMKRPTNVRGQEMRRIAGDIFAHNNPPNPS